MPQPPLPSLNRLNKVEKTHARERRVFSSGRTLAIRPPTSRPSAIA
jgi:hypothetical protein